MPITVPALYLQVIAVTIKLAQGPVKDSSATVDMPASGLTRKSACTEECRHDVCDAPR